LNLTYFGFLAIFLLPPLVIVAAINFADHRRGKQLPDALQTWPLWVVVLAHVLVALIYTTPWDNYLVATQVWWYDPDLVTGLTIGWVPIEEYVFFILQTLLTGFWIGVLARRLKPPAPASTGPDQGRLARRLQIGSTLALLILWLGSALILATGWQPGNYLALILIWALPPIMVQTIFGADILWHQRKLVAVALLSATFYLAAADAVAIQAGTWIINPEKTLGLKLGGVLPIEEFIFFLITNTLVVFGTVLVLSRASHARIPAWVSERMARFGSSRRLNNT
jgi:lycopene cyclase domain-containing protein